MHLAATAWLAGVNRKFFFLVARPELKQGEKKLLQHEMARR